MTFQCDAPLMISTNDTLYTLRVSLLALQQWSVVVVVADVVGSSSSRW